MLRIFLWKLGSEWSNLKRILRPRSDRRVYYFAFGANLSADILQQRSIGFYEAFDYVLDDAALRFSQGGFYKIMAMPLPMPRPAKESTVGCI